MHMNEKSAAAATGRREAVRELHSRGKDTHRFLLITYNIICMRYAQHVVWWPVEAANSKTKSQIDPVACTNLFDERHRENTNTRKISYIHV